MRLHPRALKKTLSALQQLPSQVKKLQESVNRIEEQFIDLSLKSEVLRKDIDELKVRRSVDASVLTNMAQVLDRGEAERRLAEARQSAMYFRSALPAVEQAMRVNEDRGPNGNRLNTDSETKKRYVVRHLSPWNQ
jgi:septal ring factor EnvC (AmiA/AmiB activator)